ncbi:MAG TPA: hypothetical protein VGK19_13955 [Capsulimonadaceae bacterium]|jgi:hypothetical protein
MTNISEELADLRGIVEQFRPLDDAQRIATREYRDEWKDALANDLERTRERLRSLRATPADEPIPDPDWKPLLRIEDVTSAYLDKSREVVDRRLQAHVRALELIDSIAARVASDECDGSH